jgi:hypothetical protein
MLLRPVKSNLSLFPLSVTDLVQLLGPKNAVEGVMRYKVEEVRVDDPSKQAKARLCVIRSIARPSLRS